MGGIVGHLLCLYCCSGCQASVVASALAFHPPEPSYYFSFCTDEEKQKRQEERQKEREKELTEKGEAVPPTPPSSGSKAVTKKAKSELVSHEEMSLSLSETIVSLDLPTLSAHLLTLKRNMKVPLFCIRMSGAKHTILFSHGNATDLGEMLVVYAILALNLKVNVVAYDYTGYGVSMQFGVRPTEKQTYRDIDAVYDWIHTCEFSSTLLPTGNAANDLILYGQSVGSGPSCYLASKRSIAGLILHSPILSGLRVLTDSRALACFDIFPNIDRLTRFGRGKSPNCLVFVIHGEQDREVGFQHGQRLYNALPETNRADPWWVKGRGHNDILQSNEALYVYRLKVFIKQLEAKLSGNLVSDIIPAKTPPSNMIIWPKQAKPMTLGTNGMKVSVDAHSITLSPPATTTNVTPGIVTPSTATKGNVSPSKGSDVTYSAISTTELEVDGGHEMTELRSDS